MDPSSLRSAVASTDEHRWERREMLRAEFLGYETTDFDPWVSEVDEKAYWQAGSGKIVQALGGVDIVQNLYRLQLNKHRRFHKEIGDKLVFIALKKAEETSSFVIVTIISMVMDRCYPPCYLTVIIGQK